MDCSQLRHMILIDKTKPKPITYQLDFSANLTQIIVNPKSKPK